MTKTNLVTYRTNIMCFVFTAEGEKGKKTSQIQRNTSERFSEQKIKPQNEKFAHVFKQGFRSQTDKPKKGNLIRQEKKPFPPFTESFKQKKFSLTLHNETVA